MDEHRGLFELSVQQDVYPAPNEGPKSVDWLPLFAGFSWVACGAQFSVVISMAPSPSSTREAASGGFFQQVLLTDCPQESGEGRSWVSSVSWAPTGISVGALAAVAGRHLYLYGPRGITQIEKCNHSWPEVPFRWVNVQVLEHHFEIVSCSWTESGDGLLSVGSEIVMWEQVEDGWQCLWRSNLEHVHQLSSASWSARGIVATAEGASTELENGEDEDEDHLVKIWWWEDGLELQVVELSHPDQLLMIQWRPLKGFNSSSLSFRPVLLTCCRDGVIRLWAEIGSFGFPDSSSCLINKTGPTPATVDHSLNGSQSACKLAFFVSAVIDVNSTLKGVLGQDIFVTWPEARGGIVRTSSMPSVGPKLQPSKNTEAPTSEWLMGIGPSGSVTLWSIQSLDDLSPSRGHIVELWQEKSNLLPWPSMPFVEDCLSRRSCGSLLSVKAVMHRPHGTVWGAPSSFDVFEIWSDNLLRWSCIWPPVSAIGGHATKVMSSTTGAANAVVGGGKMSAWGISSDIMYLDGHRGNIIQTAIHPVTSMRLVASLDNLGAVLFWLSSSSPSSPRLEIAGYSNALWKLCGKLTGHRINCMGSFNPMAWVPVVPDGADAVLLVSHPQGIDCYLISKKVSSFRGKPKSFSISHSFLCTLDWPLLERGQALEGIYTSPSLVTFDEKLLVGTCVVVGVGGNGMQLVSWKLDIKVCPSRQDTHRDMETSDHSAEKNENNGFSESPSEISEDLHNSVHGHSLPSIETQFIQGEKTIVEGQILGYKILESGEHVVSMAVTTPLHMFSGSSEGRRRSLGDFKQVFDVVTGCSDGALRLWKLRLGNFNADSDSVNDDSWWRCVGLLRMYSGPVTRVAIGDGAAKIASTGLTSEGRDTSVHVWGADTFMEDKGFSLEGSFVLPEATVSLGWLDGGNGLSVLGVATPRNVQLFAQRRAVGLHSSSGLSEGDVWACLASSSLSGITSTSISWEAQGSLVVTCEGHIMIYSNCVLTQASAKLCSSSEDISYPISSWLVDDGYFLNFVRPSSFALQDGNRKSAKSAPKVYPFEHDQGNGFCSILEAAEKIGHPSLDYHPAVIMSWLSRGNKYYARACIRQLGKFLIPLAAISITPGYEPLKARIPRTPLSQIFQEKSPIFEWNRGKNGMATFGLQIRDGNFADNFLSSYTKESLDHFTMPRNSESWTQEHESVKEGLLAVKCGGLEPLTKKEIEMISKVLKDSSEIPGLSTDDEKLQLLAITDMLAEMDGVNQPSPFESLDYPGQRFWLACRYALLHDQWRKQSHIAGEKVAIESRAMAWALQSESKEALLDICLSGQPTTWSFIRSLGVGYWFTNNSQLRKMMEKVARAQYLEKKDPKDCALLYLALDRRTVLAGLFKLSRNQKDKPLTDFVSRDFMDEKNKVAALKNAYVLMGKHRHELAAAFFILGQDIKSAAVVCAKNLGDAQLALTICHLLEGSSGPIGQDIILKYALPTARQAGDGWLASLLQWLLGKGIESLKELRIGGQNSASPIMTDVKVIPDARDECLVFPLDPDVGTFCFLLASKPRIRAGINAVEAAALAKIATTRSAAALKRTGLSLQALEYLKTIQPTNTTQSGPNSDAFNWDDNCSTPCVLPSPAFELSLTDVAGREVGLGWVSADVVAGMRRATRTSLALQCASQLLEDHPFWGGQACAAWQHPIMLKILSKSKQNVNQAGCSIGCKDDEGAAADKVQENGDLSSFLEEADKNFDADIQVLQRKYLVDVDWIVAALSTFARIHHRPYLLHRLMQGIGNLADIQDGSFHLATKSAVSALAAQYLETAGTEAPWVLARAVLACGGAASPMLSKLEVLQRFSNSLSMDSDDYAQDGVLSEFQLEELVRFGGEILLFTTAANQENTLHGKERGSQFMTLLSFTFFVAAAWLGRQTQALLALIGPTVRDPSTPPEVPSREFDAVTWFRKLGRSKSSSLCTHASGKRPLDAFEFNLAGIVTISTNDAWRVLGMMLWTHLLIYIKKQLTGTATEVSYSSFGRVSSTHSQSRMKSSLQVSSLEPITSWAPNIKGPTFLGFSLQSSALSSTWFDFKNKVRDQQVSYQSIAVASTSNGSFEGAYSVPHLTSNTEVASTTETDEFDAALLSSLTSIVAGLRKQLAAHVGHLSSESRADPLTQWLWGKPSPITITKPSVGGGSVSNFFGASSSSVGVAGPTVSNDSINSLQPSSLFPKAVLEVEDEACKELWELLVVREKICSALGLEGVSGQTIQHEDTEMVGWYFGRNGSVPAILGKSSGSHMDVNITNKLPPKRMMWNAAKDGTAISCEGVDVSPQRWVVNSQSRPQAGGECLHLSEEFSEAALEHHSPTVKKFHTTPWYPGSETKVRW